MTEVSDAVLQELDAVGLHGKRTRKLRLSWSSALPACEIGDYRVVPLTTSSELRKEGVAMRHCVGTHDILCAVGTYVVFSIRDLDGTPLATMSLVFDDHGWRLDQIKGSEDADVTHAEKLYFSGERTETVFEPTDFHFIAQEILRQYRRQTS